jgi:AcrR family transcriptional regulator
MTGPNTYRHFAGKADLLVAAVVKAGDRREAATALP